MYGSRVRLPTTSVTNGATPNRQSIRHRPGRPLPAAANARAPSPRSSSTHSHLQCDGALDINHSFRDVGPHFVTTYWSSVIWRFDPNLRASHPALPWDTRAASRGSGGMIPTSRV